MEFRALFLMPLFDGFGEKNMSVGLGAKSESRLRCFLFGMTLGRSLTLRLSILIGQIQRLKPALLPHLFYVVDAQFLLISFSFS